MHFINKPYFYAHNFIIKINVKSYLSVWLYSIFITSVVITTLVKGLTFGYLFSFLALPIGLLPKSKSSKLFLLRLGWLLLIYILLTTFSQIYLFTFPNLPSSLDNITISKEVRPYFRSSLFTQSLYLLSSFITFAFIRTYYDQIRHDRHLEKGLLIFVSLGFYFFLYYMVFGRNGDWISNREFGDGVVNLGFQAININGKSIARFVSLTGEASMYVFSVFPFFIYFVYNNRYIISCLLLGSLLLTFSGTFFIGLVIYFITLVIYSKQRLVILFTGLLLIIIITTLFTDSIINIILKEALLDKLNQNNDSGTDRSQSLINHLNYFKELPIWLIFTGMGFGYIRSTDFFSTLLVNTGLIGFALFSYLVFRPVFILEDVDRNLGIKMGLIVTYSVMMISVSEYSYLSLWLLLGMAYNQIDKEKNNYLK